MTRERTIAELCVWAARIGNHITRDQLISFIRFCSDVATQCFPLGGTYPVSDRYCT